MKLSNLFFLVFTLIVVNPVQAAEPIVIPSIPDLPPPIQIEAVETLKASSTEVVATINSLEEKIEKIKAEISENKSINFSEKVYQDYHEKLLVSVGNLLDYAPDYPEWEETILFGLEVQLETERDIFPLIEKIKKENKVKRFFFGIDLGDAKQIDAQIATALEKVHDLQFVQERQKNQDDWARLGQEVYDLRFNLEAISSDLAFEKEKFSLFGWFRKIFV